MKTVYITGATAGLGHAIAKLYADKSYKVGLIARDEKSLDDAARMFSAQTVFTVADVADFVQLEEASKN